MVERKHPRLSVTRQCALLEVSRASVYYQPAGVSHDEQELMKLMDRQYMATPFYGSRRMTVCWQSAQVGQIRTREDYYYEELPWELPEGLVVASSPF